MEFTRNFDSKDLKFILLPIHEFWRFSPQFVMWRSNFSIASLFRTPLHFFGFTFPPSCLTYFTISSSLSFFILFTFEWKLKNSLNSNDPWEVAQFPQQPTCSYVISPSHPWRLNRNVVPDWIEKKCCDMNLNSMRDILKYINSKHQQREPFAVYLTKPKLCSCCSFQNTRVLGILCNKNHRMNY